MVPRLQRRDPKWGDMEKSPKPKQITQNTLKCKKEKKISILSQSRFEVFLIHGPILNIFFIITRTLPLQQINLDHWLLDN
nr:hypothetical protein CFP56_08432 [Quercus suber]